MDISSLGAASAASLTATSTTQQARMPRYVQTAAKALGMDPSDVMTALKSGKSLADLASQKGISTTDLASAMKADAPQDVQGSSNVDAMMQKLIQQHGVSAPHGHHGHGGPPPSSSSATGALTGTLTSDQQTTLSALSSVLGTDSSSLLTQLQSGTSLASLLDAQGVSTDALAASLQKGLLIDAKS
jgi:lambda repressor-like predicted transcriptional regulator